MRLHKKKLSIVCLFMLLAAPVAGDECDLAPAPLLPETERVFVPTAGHKGSTKAITIARGNRADVVRAYNEIYLPALQVASGWNGATQGCNAGATTQAYLQATLDMVNYYRAMTGLPGNVANDGSVTQKCQQAALMMLSQGQLSHSPGTGWACYTAGGAEAAGKSNLALGRAGAGAVTMYMDDPGAGNTAVGHRRWILYPPQVTMGTGSVTGANGFYAGANDLWVIGTFGTRPVTPESVAWPPSGYVPYQLVYRRWSFGRNGADFSNATVSMTRDGTAVALTVLPIANGYGDNTIAWEPAGMPPPLPARDTMYQVTIGNVRLNAATTSFVYIVRVIDPTSAPPPQTAARAWEQLD